MRHAVAVVVVSFGLALVISAFSVPSARAEAPESWRYVFHQGQWWYWLPGNRWVYWRDGRWNDFAPSTSAAARTTTVARGMRARKAPDDGAASASDVRPFYGHALSRFDDRAPSSEEVGPFYGHALPQEVLGPWKSRRARIGPFYGHSDSSYERP